MKARLAEIKYITVGIWIYLYDIQCALSSDQKLVHQYWIRVRFRTYDTSCLKEGIQ